MTVKELIRQLRNFDENLYVEIDAVYDCGYGLAGNTVNSVKFENGNCVLFSKEFG